MNVQILTAQIFDTSKHRIIQRVPPTEPSTLLRPHAHPPRLRRGRIARHVANAISQTGRLLLLPLERLFVRVRHLEQMVGEFVPGGYGADVIRDDLALPVEVADLADDTDVRVIDGRLGSEAGYGGAFVALVDPNFNLGEASAVLDVDEDIRGPFLVRTYRGNELDHVEGTAVA